MRTVHPLAQVQNASRALLTCPTENATLLQSAGASSMVWDTAGNRVSFTSSTGGTWQFVYDVTAGIPSVIEEVTPSGSVNYTREPNAWLSHHAPAGFSLHSVEHCPDDQRVAECCFRLTGAAESNTESAI